jgi:putative endonuclease
MDKQFYVYILASKTRTLYVGVTNNIERRLYEHKNKLVEGFTKKYDVNELVYYEIYVDPSRAIEREKEIKKWRREKKIELIERMNPDWEDLTERWRN